LRGFGDHNARVGIRYRKSINIGGGVRLNLSRSGLGASVGIPGLRYSVSPGGRRRQTTSLPGTGIYSVTSLGGAPGSAAVRPTVAWTPPKPGWFAGSAEKRYHEGVLALLGEEHPAALAAFEGCLAEDPDAVSAHFFAALAGEKAGVGNARIVAHLEAVVASDVELPDALQHKYLPPAIVGLSVRSDITDHVAAELPFTSLGATLVLAEAYQQAGRLSDAIGLVVQLHAQDPENPVIGLSLADLLFSDGDYEGVIEASAAATNDSDFGAALLHLRAAALLESGMPDGALEAFREALAKTVGRDPGLLKAVRYDRALAYEHAGQHARARADLERLFAVDPNYEDVRARLTASNRSNR